MIERIPREFVSIEFKQYDELLRKERVVDEMFKICESNESNMIEEKDLNVINFGLICYKNSYEKWLKENDK